MNHISPFEAWRRKHLQGIVMSQEILELIAKAFEGGVVSEREACAWLCEITHDDRIRKGGWTANAFDCADAIRSRGK